VDVLLAVLWPDPLVWGMAIGGGGAASIGSIVLGLAAAAAPAGESLLGAVPAAALLALGLVAAALVRGEG
jgi:hypothetical protein